MEKDFDKKRIVGSLKHGVTEDSPKTLFILSIVLVAFLSAVAMVSIPLLAVSIARGAINSNGGAIGIFLIIVVVSLSVFFLLKYVRKNIRNRKKIELWLEDAVMLKAYSTMIKEVNTGISDALLGEAPKFKISIGFKYNGSHYKYKSSVDSCWGKFCDKEIDILYSPKYREVILLKPE